MEKAKNFRRRQLIWLLAAVLRRPAEASAWDGQGSLLLPCGEITKLRQTATSFRVVYKPHIDEVFEVALDDEAREVYNVTSFGRVAGHL